MKNLQSHQNIKVSRGRIRMPNAKNSVMFVPNDADGNRFISELRQYLNCAHYRVRIAGRNPDRVGVSKATGMNIHRLRQMMPNEFSTYFAVYVDGKTTVRVEDKDWRESWSTKAELTRMQQKVEALQRRLDEYETPMLLDSPRKFRLDS